jgi:hypothetical protein
MRGRVTVATRTRTPPICTHTGLRLIWIEAAQIRVIWLGCRSHFIGMPEERFGDRAAVIDSQGAGSRAYFQRVTDITGRSVTGWD